MTASTISAQSISTIGNSTDTDLIKSYTDYKDILKERPLFVFIWNMAVYSHVMTKTKTKTVAAKPTSQEGFLLLEHENMKTDN